MRYIAEYYSSVERTIRTVDIYATNDIKAEDIAESQCRDNEILVNIVTAE